MSATTTEPARRPRPSRVLACLSFAIMVGGWLTFLVAGLTSEPTLDDAWAAIRDLPLLIEGLVWLLGFPFLAGLAIWQGPWGEDVRVVAIVVLAAAYILMFAPRFRGR